MTDSKKIAVVALNGFTGDRRGHLDVGEIVNARAIMAGVPFYSRRRGGAERGGWNPVAKRRVRRWLAARVREDYTIIAVGKSFGAHWLLDFYAADLQLRKKIVVLAFDPASNLRRGEGHVRDVGGWPLDNVTVVRQKGFRSGYRVHGSTDVVVDSTHRDIEHHRDALLQLHNFMDLHIPLPESPVGHEEKA